MKQLLLIRHGKSDKGNLDIKDFDRPLNHMGNKNAVSMAEKILNKGLVLPLIVSSPALRTLSTAQHFAKIWGRTDADIQTNLSIYEANTATLLKVVNGFNDNNNAVALVGHNPGLTDFANYLSDADIHNIPTSGIVFINFEVDSWAEVSYHTGTMLLFDFPKKTENPH